MRSRAPSDPGGGIGSRESARGGAGLEGREPAEVRLDGLVKRYGDTQAVQGVTLTVGRGEFFSLLGPSGCGKTTVLRIIAGFTPPDAGEVFIDGEPVTHLPPWRRDVGLVFQNYALWPHLTVFENIAFGLRERRLPGAQVRARVQEALVLIELEGVERRRPSELSGGQQQRVALARTLVLSPRVLLLDEPLSNLDAKLRVAMREELLRLQQRLRITTVYVTHDQEEALALSGRIAVMSGGRVVQVGSPREIYEAPADRFVAEFVGVSNLLEGRVEAVAGGVAAVKTPGGLLLQARAGPGARPGQPGAVLLRPEALRLGGGRETDHCLEGVLVNVTFLGAVRQCEVEVDGGVRLKVHVPGLRRSELPPIGSRVQVRVDPADIILIA